jgi:hypothetical protein
VKWWGCVLFQQLKALRKGFFLDMYLLISRVPAAGLPRTTLHELIDLVKMTTDDIGERRLDEEVF